MFTFVCVLYNIQCKKCCYIFKQIFELLFCFLLFLFVDDELVFKEELFSNDGDKSSNINHSIEYTYRALDPVSFIELRTAHVGQH